MRVPAPQTSGQIRPLLARMTLNASRYGVLTSSFVPAYLLNFSTALRELSSQTPVSLPGSQPACRSWNFIKRTTSVGFKTDGSAAPEVSAAISICFLAWAAASSLAVSQLAHRLLGHQPSRFRGFMSLSRDRCLML